VDVVRDLLDKRIVDRNGREIGRVDSIVLEVRDGAPPRIAALEIGPAVLAFRIHAILGRIVSAIEHAFGVDEGRPLRIPVGKILDISDHVKVDVAAGQTAAATVEQHLRRWVSRIPGSS
jgi:sporulation protein YlmC with PRC-barrel domain